MQARKWGCVGCGGCCGFGWLVVLKMASEAVAVVSAVFVAVAMASLTLAKLPFAAARHYMSF
eukprot:8236522-Ditylum_brightwellii.AAC.1